MTTSMLSDAYAECSSAAVGFNHPVRFCQGPHLRSWLLRHVISTSHETTQPQSHPASYRLRATLV